MNGAQSVWFDTVIACWTIGLLGDAGELLGRGGWGDEADDDEGGNGRKECGEDGIACSEDGRDE
jgi:hypothetical protein